VSVEANAWRMQASRNFIDIGGHRRAATRLSHVKNTACKRIIIALKTPRTIHS
jgi:hypothetical protein